LGGAVGRFEIGGDDVGNDVESLLKFGGVGLHLVDAAGGEDDVVADGGEVVSQCLADAGRGTGNQGDWADGN
jgi:hypothetical protein